MSTATVERPTEQDTTLYLDRETHVYSQGGVTVTDPSVTTILADCGLIDTTYFNELAAWRGSLVHLACQLHDEGDLDESTLDPALIPYLTAWKSFKLETGWFAYQIECPRRSSLHGFVGTPDQIGAFPNGEYLTDLDIKSGEAHYSTKFQTAGYTLLAAEDPPLNGRVLGRCAVKLRKNGTYKYIEYPVADLRRDQQTFLSALNIFHTKKLHGG